MAFVFGFPASRGVAECPSESAPKTKSKIYETVDHGGKNLNGTALRVGCFVVLLIAGDGTCTPGTMDR
eukprot:3243141-Amphidinium_carterae.2